MAQGRDRIGQFAKGGGSGVGGKSTGGKLGRKIKRIRKSGRTAPARTRSQRRSVAKQRGAFLASKFKG